MKEKSKIKEKVNNFKNNFMLNIKPITSYTFYLIGIIFTGISFLFSFVSLNEMIELKIGYKIIIFFSIIFICFIVSTILILYIFKTKKIWTRGKNKVTAMYGDLMKIAFDLKSTCKKIILIPVNDCFDTIVESTGEHTIKPLVSINSIHGVWINRYCKNTGLNPNELSEKIQKNLDLQGIKPTTIYTKEEKVKGNLKSYDIGTTAVIDGANNNIIFFLLVISKFNENNNAQSSKRIIRDAFEKFLDFYDKNGQGDQLFIPLLGTGLSRASLSHEQSFKLLKSCILTSENKLNGDINIVVYNKDKEKVSIFK